MATRIDPRPTASVFAAMTGVIALFAIYGLWSMPGLAARWGGSTGAPLVLMIWIAAAALAVPLYRAAPRHGRLAACAVTAIGLRLASAWLVADRLPVGDAANYLTLAAHVRAGQGLWLYETDIGGVARAFYPPLYPLLLAAWGCVAGFTTIALSMLSLAIDTAAALAIARLGSAIGRPGAGRAAGWLYLIWPATLLSAPLAQKEGLCVLLIVLLAGRWIAATRHPGLRASVAIGALAGLLALTQPGEAPIALLIGIAMVPVAGIRRIARIGVYAVPVAMLVMCPWWVRNAVVLHQFVPLTSAGGLSLWVGNNPAATGNWMPPPRAWDGMPEIAYGRHAGAVAQSWIAGHPLSFARLSIAKLLRTLGIAQAGVVRLAAMHPAPAQPVLAALASLGQLSWIALLAAAAWGMRTAGRTALLPRLLVVACLAQMAGFGLWFEFAERHREFATPFLLLLAIAGLERAGRWRGGLTFPKVFATWPPSRRRAA